ncbi:MULTISPECIES: SDR family NAD(P)-dependent oxidoreductase [Sphingobium]|uniref:SDR family NAD(P)-dependent oxidoreductase n=1 Tax=Sphingobium TaxID=165695 RepID=UPI00159C3743|nr:SDR family NAD(P)-dependent oxidoreductase [Sphingobium sp. 15-1]
MSVHLITGGAGFIGVNLAKALLDRGFRVVALDDLSRGRRETMKDLLTNPDFSFIKADCSDPDILDTALDTLEIDEIWHMAANSDIPAGVADYRVDLRQTFLTTVAILDVMRRRNIGMLHFASSSAIYGDLGDQKIHEDIGPLQPISNYGAMKLASEAQIRAAHEAFVAKVSIFRFPNVIGIPATHGVILDFIQKLKRDAGRLEVLGDGTQQKAYLHVLDLVAAMLHIRDLNIPYAVFNIGPTDDGITVRSIAERVRDQTGGKAELHFGQGNRGWVGDVPRFRYSVERLMASGWAPTMSSEAAMHRSVDEIIAQEASA